MRQIAERLHLLAKFPPYVRNLYLMGDVLIDAGAWWDGPRILRQLRGHAVSAVALTHAHPDHQGASHVVCTALRLPLWCGRKDAPAVEDRRLMIARSCGKALDVFVAGFMMGPSHPVARRLDEGDEVGGFTVLEVPGHTLGHIAFWRPRDRILVLGDVVTNMKVSLLLPGLHEPPSCETIDVAENRRSARRLAALKPNLLTTAQRGSSSLQ
jgi:hydroxyacylglutathione hydrolase